MAFAPLIFMAASAAVAAYGQIQQGKVASANAKSQEQAAYYNATVNQQNAQQSGMEASSRELAQRNNQAQQLGNIRAGLAETGGGETGTNAGVLNQSEVNMELDALTTRYQGVLGARAYNAQAGLDYYQGKVAHVNAGAAKQAGYWGAASSLLSGASKMYGYNNAGTSGYT
jgi:hypothetical protein